MSDQADTLIIKPTSIEINNQSNGIIHENGNHSPSKSLKLKIGNENEPEALPTTTLNDHPPPPSSSSPSAKPNSNDHIYETPSNLDSNRLLSFETPTISSSDEHGNKQDDNSHLSSTPPNNEHHVNDGIDSGLSSEMTNANTSCTETEKTNFDDETSSTSGLTTSSIISAARLLETNINEINDNKRESSPTGGVIIPEEKRVTDRVKVFEAVANNDQSTLKKQQHPTKNGNQKKTSSNGKQQISPSSTSSTTESIDIQSTNESKSSSSSSSKNKSKRPSLKKQIQNLLKIDKPISPDEGTTIIEEQPTVTNGKKSNTINSTHNKRDNGNKEKKKNSLI
jgi:hypothetical protein